MARPLLGIFALAALLRVAFALWSPGLPLSDGLFYHLHAQDLAETGRYLNPDGSPAIRWMPGWPVALAALYRLVGDEPRAGMLLCALLDAGTAALTAALGARLFGRRVGVGAGLLHALWPGAIYYSGNLFTEPAFGLLLVGTLLLLAQGTPGRRSPARELGAGLCFGLAALVKSEPLALAPALLFAIWRLDPVPRAWLRRSAALLLVTAALLAPWTLRNWLTFGRFIPTSASGGVVVQLGNHPGATGGQDFKLQRELEERHRGATVAETVIRRNDVGWADARRFFREHPGEAFATALRKLRLTYGGDSQGIRTIRGTGRPQHWNLAPGTYRRLVALADGWWWAALTLAAVGLTGFSRWPAGSGALLLCTLASFVVLHALFLGGQRFHAPEVPIFAVLASLGIQRLHALARSLQPDPSSSRST